MALCQVDVAHWHKADMTAGAADVRFREQGGLALKTEPLRKPAVWMCQFW